MDSIIFFPAQQSALLNFFYLLSILANTNEGEVEKMAVVGDIRQRGLKPC